MANKNLVGRCGLYCGSCIIYRAYKDSQELRQRVAEKEDCQLEEIRCEGCQTVLSNGWDIEEIWGKNCKIVECLEEQGLDFCYECGSYPNCDKFKVIYDSELKHSENLVENLRKIKAGKIEEWLAVEEAKWRCRKCRNPIPKHLAECHWCGAKIKG